MKLFAMLSLVLVSGVLVVIPTTFAVAGERLIVVTQPGHVQVVNRLLGRQVEVKLLLPAGAAPLASRTINAHVRGLGKPELLLVDSSADDGLCRLWCERLVNSTGTVTYEIPLSVLSGSKEARRSTGESIALTELARRLGNRFPNLRGQIQIELKALLAELGQRTEGAALVSLAKNPGQSAP